MATIAQSNKATISAIDALLDQREIAAAVSDIQNDAGLMDIMHLADRYKPVAKGGGVYHNYVNEGLYKILDTTGATVTGSGTATINTAFTAGTSKFIRKTDLVKFPSGKVGYVTAVTRGATDSVTIKSVDGSNITHTAGEKLTVISNAFGEKSTAPENRVYGLTRYSNNIQIFREVNEITDVQNSATIEVEYKGQNKILFKDLLEKALKFKGDINGAFIGGVRSSTLYSDASPALTDPINSGAVQTTGGLDWYITSQGGVSDAVATAGTVVLADFEEIFGLLIAAKAPKKYMAYVPSKAMAKIDNCLKGLASSGVTSAKLNLDGKSIDFDVQNFKYMGFDVDFAYMGILDSQEMFSQTNIVKSMYLVPKDGVKVHGGEGTLPRIQVRYFESQVKGGNNIVAEWNTGALAPEGPTSDEMIFRTNWESAQGLECLGVQHFAKYQIL